MGSDRSHRRSVRTALAAAALAGLVACAGGSDGGLRIPGTAAGEGDACGGIAGVACAEGLWCDPEPGTCDQADVQGTCRVVPEVCSYDYRPVCGCDSRTYANDCGRRTARVAEDHDGVCGVDAPGVALY